MRPMALNKNQTIKTKFQIYFIFRSIMCPTTLNENQAIKTKFQICCFWKYHVPHETKRKSLRVSKGLPLT